jgi:hypothetical protein
MATVLSSLPEALKNAAQADLDSRPSLVRIADCERGHPTVSVQSTILTTEDPDPPQTSVIFTTCKPSLATELLGLDF